MERNENEKIEAMLAEKKAEAKAYFMLLDLLASVVPDEDRPMFELPKVCGKAIKKLEKVMMNVKDFDGFDEGKKYAVEACAFLARVDEATEAFLEQYSPSKSGDANDSDMM